MLVAAVSGQPRACLFSSGKLDDASADAALGIDPNLSSSLFVRGLIEAKRGDAAASRRDVAAAATLDPLTLTERKRFGPTP